MKIPEAIALLDGAKSKDKPSRINQSLTENQAIDLTNLQILCEACNMGKSNLFSE